MKKGNLRVVVAVVIMVLLVTGYYFYLSHRDTTGGKQEETVKVNGNSAAAEIAVRDLDNNYPESPREVLKLYAKITQAYYASDTTDEQVEQLGTQARKLFDTELRSKENEEQFLKSLKAEISDYHSKNRYISDYKVDSSTNIQYKTIDGKSYAIATVLYYMREGNNLTNVYHSYKLRKDDDGRWKILYWELSSSKQLGEE
jgi:hypothetical protein